jgi:hypothetical protein
MAIADRESISLNHIQAVLAAKVFDQYFMVYRYTCPEDAQVGCGCS